MSHGTEDYPGFSAFPLGTKGQQSARAVAKRNQRWLGFMTAIKRRRSCSPRRALCTLRIRGCWAV